MRVACGLCLALAAVWCLQIALYPVWIGRFHNPVGDGSTAWYHGGVFAVKGGNPAAAAAPIWAPPVPYGENIPATARWPWQPVTRREHVEIDVSAWVRSWAFAILTVGAVLGAIRFVIDRRTPHRLVTVWWSLTLSLAAAWIGLLGLQVVTSGQAPSGDFDIGVFAIAAVVGVAVGLAWHRAACARVARQAAGGKA